jgi:[ribosomal protein S5]-alanine N-acetyltransferase
MSPVVLVDATAALLDAAVAGPARLGQLLEAAVAEGWEGFPEALPALRASYTDRPGAQDWGTLLFVLDAPRTLVGLGGYKGAPSADGVVEIGYAIAPAFQGRGLASEAVRSMISRAFAEPRVEAVDAHTLAHRNPSTRVLEKAGFARIAERRDPDDGAIWQWRLQRPR